jgi:hypothetical protein
MLNPILWLLAPLSLAVGIRKTVVLAVVLTVLLIMGITVVRAQTSVTGALYSLALNITNSGASDQSDLQVASIISTGSLIEEGFISADALNTIVQKGGVDVPAMPGTDRIVVKGAALDDGGAFTDYTTEAQNTTTSDVPLLPAVPVVNDAFYFGFDLPAGMATINIDRAGVGTWAVTWEYYNGSSWTALSGVDDRTSAFSVLGRNIVLWDIPSDWSATTVVSINAYWVRARVSSFTSVTTQPLGSLVQWETGQWWTWVESLPVETQEQFLLYLGGADMVTYHQLFTGSAGIVTSDAAGLEPGNTFAIGLNARPHFNTLGSSSCLVCKDGVLAVYPSAIGELTSTVTGATTTTLISPDITLGDTGSHNVVIASDGTDFGVFVDGGSGLVAGDAQTLTDNANDWTWVSSGGVDYSDQIAYDAGTADVIDLRRSYSEWAAGTLDGTSAYTGKIGLANN